MRIPAPALEKLWPRLFLFAVLGLFCAVAIHKASLAIAPPVYDGLSYYWKSISMLRAIEAGGWLHLMSAEPSMRPPGLLLLNGVFGIHRDVLNFHGFFALNMILPVLIWSLACWIAIPLRRATSQGLWRKSIAVAALSLLPMFLQFEYSESIRVSSSWGMQDTALAACAALAMALVLHSLRRRNVATALAGFFLAGFTILIKPAGILVILSVAGAWMFGAFSRWLLHKSSDRRRLHARYCLPILLLGIGILSAIACAAFFSPYFSKETIEVSIRNQTALVSMTQRASFLPIIVQTLSKSLGAIWSVFFLLAISGSVVLLSRYPNRKSLLLLWPSLFSALAILGASLYWWRYMAGTEARYILPFLCLVLILLLPVMWACWTRCCPTRFRSGIFGFLAFIVLLYSSALAWPGEIPARWQEFLGINLSAGAHRPSVEAAEFLTQKAAQFDRPLAFLQAELPYSLAFISASLILENLKMEGAFKIDSSFDWKSEKTIPRTKVIHCDFIALNQKPRNHPSGFSSIASYGEELRLFISWLSVLDGNSGIQRHSFGQIDILEVVDRNQFEAAFEALLDSKAPLWRREFLEYNGYLGASWQDDDRARTSFSATGKNLGGILVGSRDLVEARLVQLGECIPLGIDPYILLKPFRNHGSRKARIQVQTIATAPGALQIFYSGQADAFSEADSVWLPIAAGFNEVTTTIPLEGEFTWTRIDFPGPPVENMIKKITATLLDPLTDSPKP